MKLVLYTHHLWLTIDCADSGVCDVICTVGGSGFDTYILKTPEETKTHVLTTVAIFVLIHIFGYQSSCIPISKTDALCF